VAAPGESRCTLVRGVVCTRAGKAERSAAVRITDVRTCCMVCGGSCSMGVHTSRATRGSAAGARAQSRGRGEGMRDPYTKYLGTRKQHTHWLSACKVPKFQRRLGSIAQESPPFVASLATQAAAQGYKVPINIATPEIKKGVCLHARLRPQCNSGCPRSKCMCCLSRALPWEPGIRSLPHTRMHT